MARTIPEFLTFRGGKWVPQLTCELRDIVTFAEIKFFYANIVDYVRIAMCLIAAFTIITEWHLLSAFLILGSTLLDWVDGPVARAYNQCSIFGCGADWLADLLCQLIMIVWWAQYDPNVIPWVLIVTCIEIGTGLFDFATTSTVHYPILKKGQSGFFVILEWSMPQGSYTHLGIFIWLAYPFYCVLRTLECCYGYNTMIDMTNPYVSIEESNFVLILFLLNRYFLFVPAFLYAWCEAAYGAHIVRSWTEMSRKVKPADDEIIYDDASTSILGGFIHYGTLSSTQQHLLQDIYTDLHLTLHPEYQLALSKHEVFWVNIWQRSGEKTGLIVEFKDSKQLDEMVHSFIAKYYDVDEVILDGYGYILNPINSQAQVFHIDYTLDYSSLFIPLTNLSCDNAVQYIIPSPSIDPVVLLEATKDCDRVDLNLLLQDGNSYSVRQCISKPFTILKMNFGTIHRAISNQDVYNRLMFYISVIKKSAAETVNIVNESLIQTIKRDR